jgi:hypothetical protein
MASTYSTNLALELIGTGEQSGTWGTTTNTNLGTLLEQAISGYVTQAITDGSGANTTITIPNGTTGVARNMFIEMTGALTFATTSLIVPANKKMYFIFNNTSGGFAVTVKVSGQTGILVPNGKKVILTCNGTDIVEAHTAIVGNATMGGTLASGTITVSSDMVIATGSITSASGAVTFGNENLSTTGKLTAGAGVTAAGNVGSSFGSTFTSDGAGSVVVGTYFAGTMTTVTGDTTYLDHVNINRSVVTQNNSETIGRIATLMINEPDITKGTDTVTLAATVYVGAAPDEGVSNYAIYVAGGACSFGGSVSAATGLTGGSSTHLGSGSGSFIGNASSTATTNALDVGNAATTGDNRWLRFYTEAGYATQRGSIDFNRAATLTRYNTTSDGTLKTILGDAPQDKSVGILKSTRLREFFWNEDSTKHAQIGPIAQELHATFKGAVSVGGWTEEEEIGDGEDRYTRKRYIPSSDGIT